MNASWDRAAGPDANHRRVIAATLRSLDKALCTFDSLATGRETRSVLYHQTNSLTQAQRRAIAAESAGAREILGEIARRLNLAAEPNEAAAAIWSRCFMLKEALSELEGARLDAYGALSPELRAFIHPMIARLQRRIEGILRIAGAAAGKGAAQ